MLQTRQLAAIMFTDIVGYTALMGEDEQKAFEVLTKNRELQKPIIEKYGGRWIKELGDGVLATFTTVSDAVYAAQDIQQQCNQNSEFALRIGIHHGEIVLDWDDVFGDAVNVASRIQAIAPVGGIYISESVQYIIANRTDIETRFIKAEKLKNVREPLKVYEVITAASLQSSTTNKMIARFRKKGSTKYALILLALFLLAGAYLTYTFFTGKSSTASEEGATEKSIAVLPFVNMSNDKEQEYFSDGLSEEVLNLLTKVEGLKVIARTSSFAFKGKNEDIRSISEKLGVAHILEGSVRKAGNQLRVNAQLINSEDGRRLWSEVFEREMSDIFKLQDEIATAVVRELKLRLLPQQASRSESPEAHNLILQGNYFHERLDRENVARSLQLYRQALEIDSSNARAWAMLAKTYSRSAWQNYIPQQEGYEKARATVMKALAIDPNNTDALITLAGVKLYYDFEWNQAEELIKKAIQFEPTNASALNILGVINQVTGTWKKAIQYHNQAISLDPLRPILYSNQGANYTYNKEYDNANEMYRKALEINPDFQRAHMYIGRNYLLTGKPKLALGEMHKENVEMFKHFGLALAYHAIKDNKVADSLLNSFVSAYHKEWPYLIAELYAFRNQKEEAVNWLEKAYRQNDSWLTWIKGDPLLKNIWNHPRYIDILKKMDLL